MINLADLPAVRAQLEQLTRDIAEGKMQAAAVAPRKKPEAQAAEQAAYPARNLVFENGCYKVADRNK